MQNKIRKEKNQKWKMKIKNKKEKSNKTSRSTVLATATGFSFFFLFFLNSNWSCIHTCLFQIDHWPCIRSCLWRRAFDSTFRVTPHFFQLLSWKKKSLHFENKFIYGRRNECISIENPLVSRVSPLWLSHSRQSSGKPFVELLEVLWSDGTPDHSCQFLDSFPLLRLDLQFQIDSTNHRKIGDINEAHQICKQSTQTASI